MEVKSLTRYAKMSPTKVRPLARLLRGKNPSDVLEQLQIIPLKAARLIYKTLKSAIANAENNLNLSTKNLIIDNVFVQDGPALRRFMPAAKGSAHPFKKRMCHIKVVLIEKDDQKKNLVKKLVKKYDVKSEEKKNLTKKVVSNGPKN